MGLPLSLQHELCQSVCRIKASKRGSASGLQLYSAAINAASRRFQCCILLQAGSLGSLGSSPSMQLASLTASAFADLFRQAPELLDDDRELEEETAAGQEDTGSRDLRPGLSWGRKRWRSKASSQALPGAASP